MCCEIGLGMDPMCIINAVIQTGQKIHQVVTILINRTPSIYTLRPTRSTQSRLQTHNQRFLLPREPRPLIHPLLVRLRTNLHIERPQHMRQRQPNLRQSETDRSHISKLISFLSQQHKEKQAKMKKEQFAKRGKETKTTHFLPIQFLAPIENGCNAARRSATKRGSPSQRSGTKRSGSAKLRAEREAAKTLSWMPV